MIKGTIKDYTITTLEELIERKVIRDHNEHKVCIHTDLALLIIGFKSETKQRNKCPYYQDKWLYIRYLNMLGKEIY